MAVNYLPRVQTSAVCAQHKQIKQIKDNDWVFFASGIIFFSEWEPLSLRKGNFQSIKVDKISPITSQPLTVQTF